MDLQSPLEFSKNLHSSLLRALLLGQIEILTGAKDLTISATIGSKMLSPEAKLAGEYTKTLYIHVADKTSGGKPWT